MKSVIILPDMHVPFHDRRVWRNVLRYIAGTGPHDEVVQLGDFLNLASISRHTKTNLRAIAETTITEEYRIGNQVLDQLQEVIQPETKITILEGNHDFWVEKYLDEHPQLVGTLEIEKGLRLKERGINWVRFWRDGAYHKIGKAVFVHGLHLNKHHSCSMAMAYGNNIFYGHTHDVQCHSLTRQGEHNTIVGQSLGCLCEYDQKYMQGKPTKWQQAFAHFFFNPNGTFQYYVIRVFNGKFIGPNGKEYR